MSQITIPLRPMAPRSMELLEAEVVRMASASGLSIRLDSHEHELALAGVKGSLLDALRDAPSLVRLVQLYGSAAVAASVRKTIDAPEEMVDKAFTELLVRVDDRDGFDQWRLLKAEDHRQALAIRLPQILTPVQLGLVGPEVGCAAGSDWDPHHETLTATVHCDQEHTYARFCVPLKFGAIQGFLEAVELECVEIGKRLSQGFATVTTYSNWDANQGTETKIRVLGAKRASSRLDALAMHQAVRDLTKVGSAGLLDDRTQAAVKEVHQQLAKEAHPGIASQMEQEIDLAKRSERKGLLALIGK